VRELAFLHPAQRAHVGALLPRVARDLLWVLRVGQAEQQEVQVLVEGLLQAGVHKGQLHTC
jgi:hypothetical protein